MQGSCCFRVTNKADDAVVARRVIICTFVIATALVVIALLIGHSYENRTYSTDSYTNAEEQIRLRLKVDKICESARSQEENHSCEEITEALGDHATLNDLAAQETVALATRGLLWTGVFQGAVSALTLAFLIWTVFITREMREQATKSTGSMNEALEATQIAQRAHVFGMAYARFEDAKLDGDARPPHIHSADVEFGHFTYWAEIENSGQTPARDVRYTFIRNYGSKGATYLKETRYIGSIGGGCKRQIFEYTDDTSGYVKISELDNARDLTIRISVSYTDVFGIRHGPTISNCRLQFGAMAGGRFRVLTKEEALKGRVDFKGGLAWKLSEMRDVHMRVRQTTVEDRKIKREKKAKS